jgi:hypothetical protein
VEEGLAWNSQESCAPCTLQVLALQKAWQLPAPNKRAVGTLDWAHAFLFALGAPLLVFRLVRHDMMYADPTLQAQH